MLKLHKESHLDHGIPEEVVNYLIGLFSGREGFFIETVKLPEQLPPVPCGLHGPAMGDEPIPESEVEYVRRGPRTYESRVTRRDPRLVRVVTVVAGPHDGEACVLYTAFGGVQSPQEPGDPACKDQEASKAFWAEHALTRT